MTTEYIIVLALIAVLSIVQSFFGMGILVFGTPTLLLMGYDFPTTLGYLLPASFAISTLQVVLTGTKRVPVSPYLYLFCTPGIFIGLWLTETGPIVSSINALVGGTLLFSAIIRFWSPSRNLTSAVLNKHLPTYHFIMGLVHGLTNLGGAFLAILASELNTEKEAIRYTIAHYYLAFSVIQMLLLATIMGHHDILLNNLLAAVVSSLVYFLVGNRFFLRTSNKSFNLALTLFIAIYGVVILSKL
jgi:uncharacterized protein